MSRRAENANALYKTLAAKLPAPSNLPSLSMIHVSAIGSKAARINLIHPNTSRKAYSRNDYSAAFAVLSHNEGYLIPQTIEILPYDRANYKLISGIVRANNTSLPFEEAIAERKLKVITANVFMDDENNTWNLEGEGDDRRLVQTRCEDFGQLITSRLKRIGNIALASSQTVFEGSNVKNADYVLAYCVDTDSFRSGVVVASDAEKVTIVGAKDTFTVDRAQIVVSADTDLNFDANIVRAFAEKDVKARAKLVMDYLKQVYADKQFMTEYSKLVTAAVADCEKPLAA